MQGDDLLSQPLATTADPRKDRPQGSLERVGRFLMSQLANDDHQHRLAHLCGHPLKGRLHLIRVAIVDEIRVLNGDVVDLIGANRRRPSADGPPTVRRPPTEDRRQPSPSPTRTVEPLATGPSALERFLNDLLGVVRVALFTNYFIL